MVDKSNAILIAFFSVFLKLSTTSISYPIQTYLDPKLSAIHGENYQNYLRFKQDILDSITGTSSHSSNFDEKDLLKENAELKKSISKLDQAQNAIQDKIHEQRIIHYKNICKKLRFGKDGNFSMKYGEIKEKIAARFDLEDSKVTHIIRLAHNGLKAKEEMMLNSSSTGSASSSDIRNSYTNYSPKTFVDLVTCVTPSTGLDSYMYALGALQKAQYIEQFKPRVKKSTLFRMILSIENVLKQTNNDQESIRKILFELENVDKIIHSGRA